jgi:DNA-binding IclR family transcriptional regulator
MLAHVLRALRVAGGRRVICSPSYAGYTDFVGDGLSMSAHVSDLDPSARRAGAVGRVFAILRVLRRRGTAAALTSIANEAGIPASTAHALLTQLLDEGAVVLDENKQYHLGPALFYLGSAYSRGTPLFRSTWIEIVDLANEFSVTAALGVPWDEHHLIIAAHKGGELAVDVAFGGRIPLDGGSWGKVYYASANVELPAKLTPFTPKTITDRDAYAAEIEKVRAAGHARDDEEFREHVVAVAASVTSASGYEGLASLMWSVNEGQRFELDAVGRRLAAVAARASLSLGDPTRIVSVGFE